MPSPSSSLATQRPDLAESFMEFDLAMDSAGFIAHRVFPIVEVDKQAGNFGKIPIEQLLQNRDTLRAPGSAYSRGQWTFEPATYATHEHGVEEPIDDREAKMYREYFDAEMIAGLRAFRAVMENAEKRLAAQLFNKTTWTGADLLTEVSNEWDDANNATPVVDVEAAVNKVYDNSGLWPNALIINRKVFRNLRNVDEIIDRSKSQGFMDVRQGEINEAHLSQVFDLPFILVAGGSKNASDEGQDASISQVWSDEFAMVARIATGPDFREPCVGRTFHWSEDGSSPGGTVETYRDETVRSDIVRVRHDVDEVTLYVEAAHLLENITT